MTELIRTSHSTNSTVNSCPRKLLFEKELRLFPEVGSIAMRYGSAFHKGMEAYYTHDKDLVKAMEAAAVYWSKPTKQVFNEDYRNLESLLSSLSLYHEQYKNDNEVVAVVPEHKISTIISLTDEEKSCYGDIAVDFVVVIDLVLAIDKMKWVVDFKTTSVELAYMASKLRKMVQLMGYQFVGQQNFDSIAGTMVYYHQLKASKSRKTGEYGETKTDFMKFPQIHADRDYEDWRKFVIWNAFKVMKAQEAGYPPAFDHCFDFNKTCEYMPLCEYPKWDIDRFLEMDGFVVVPDERLEENNEAL